MSTSVLDKHAGRRWAVVTAEAGTIFIAAGAFWGVTLLVDSRYQEGTTRRDVIETQEVHPGVQG